MSNILNKYHLSFSVKTVHDMKLAISSTTTADYYPLSNFLCECYWSTMAEDIIDDLENILAQQSTADEFQTRGIIIVSDISETKFVEDSNSLGFIDPDLVIPTIDFRDVMNEWKNFLQKIGI